MRWTDWSKEEPDFPTCECSDSRSSTPGWMSLTRARSVPLRQTEDNPNRKHRKKDKTYTIFGMAVLVHEDGSMEIGTRTYFRREYRLSNSRVRSAIESGKSFVSRGKTYFLRNATPEEESSV